ncbi:helix-turn-helix domain-containing protein [Streptomyces sp. NPDC048665]|uniref:MmyB family transcriptional regulator n=1 Tax=Streptomyces sp. NPDC048665 TaxID=3155490 RepID=UPI0034171339
MTDGSTGRPVAQQTITRVLRRARERIDPRDVPGLAAAFDCRGSRGLTQGQVAHLVDVSTKWYRNLELGKPKTYSKSFLESVRRVLELSEDEWETVWQLTHGRPAPRSAPESPDPAAGQQVPSALRRFVDAQSWPAYVYNHRWDLLHYNAAALRDYPWMLHGTNVMSWALTYPEARIQLINWEHDWAMPMIAHLRYHAELWKDDLGLQALVKTVRSDPAARALWDSPHLPTPPATTASTRRLYLPRQGATEFEVTMLAMRIEDTPSSRLMSFVPSAVAGKNSGA